MNAPNQHAGLTLAECIVSAPVLVEAAAARARVDEWLSSLAAVDAQAIRAVFAAHRLVGTLIESLAESSPFLWDLITSDAARLLALLQAEPEGHLAALLERCGQEAAQTDDLATAMRSLRKMKAEAALLIALADIGGVWPIMQATRALTQLADTAVDAAVRFALAEAARAGKLEPKDANRPHVGSGYIVLAMGKMGAFELNYSSDIDLIVFFDPDIAPLADGIEAAPTFVRITQRVVKLLQEHTGDGYVFRTDLRLRPDPGSTGIAISTPAALAYYEGMGQNWERAMLIKGRPCAGDIAAGEAILNELSPFVWRKYLDFVAVGDVHAMKRQINAYRGHGEIAVEGHNIKLGRGGIREIEFFAQTQQLIAGGRNLHLRDRDTLTTLDKLCDDGWIGSDARGEMKAAYLFLRSVEHRLQMINDEQTQELPESREAMERFARFLGFESRDAFAAVLVGYLRMVQRHYARLFQKEPESDAPALNFPDAADDPKTLARLGEMGFRAPLEASHIVRQWLRGEHRSLNGEAARNHLVALLPVLLEQLGRTDNPNATLLLFDHFLGNLHGASRLLSLLQQKPDLIALTALVLGAAPRLGETLARHPQVMDALVDPSFFGVLPDDEELQRRLDAALAQARYDEDLLERIRMFGLEYLFLIGVRILTGTLTARAAGEAYARLADAILRAVHRAVAENFASVYGHVRDEQTAVVAMGKLGGREMTAASDLDLIMIYDFDGETPESDGRRSLYGGQYFARLTQRLINTLTAQTNYGALYQVDMRLRPSGQAGPLATQIGSFIHYQENEAWTWEHMALTRARVISGSSEFAERVGAVFKDILCRPRDAALTAGDVAEMRGAIATEKGDGNSWDLKYAKGGLVDLEFIAQYLQLVHAHDEPSILDTSTARVLDLARQLRLISVEDAEVLRPAAQLYHDLTQILRLCLSGPFDPKTAGPGLLRLLTRAADVPDFATLNATLLETQAKVRASFVRILGREP
ncbi:bifunctional [glutamine synthetase] adenylyltransferase/[glutamine synthetase]-adenylyl-L-tyrosine phosphorylase [Undibacter mobilis]|uniref:Bifunctional glutamine synthetase adenylyltransferase/adenylyl-removing enzyme n=1 Tax=Undibacter mobilis TaxID=2292256 RepID=A0A371B3T6_9BRAD|nr:bifunctional [glutamine synthetase] adenylyltransferase/[glutamine synthetase]-adenylyl-L-tyrosine phosphorylase [Undibacter mobilis]RDV02121.1 bifunctional [glutamine synthetase] adenylyltransferase/[glutamine synthetase]-adenylyl-L-tyrosine phosphorylase [Undibacter mobilis]